LAIKLSDSAGRIYAASYPSIAIYALRNAITTSRAEIIQKPLRHLSTREKFEVRGAEKSEPKIKHKMQVEITTTVERGAFSGS